MKLLRVGEVGKEAPALMDSGGQLRDLSLVVAEIGGATLLLSRTPRRRLRRCRACCPLMYANGHTKSITSWIASAAFDLRCSRTGDYSSCVDGGIRANWTAPNS
jgi:hypothetical protein